MIIKLQAEEVKLIRDITGISMFDIKKTHEKLNSDNLLFTACYSYAESLAVNVKSDRHLFNIKIANEKYPALFLQNIEELKKLKNFDIYHQKYLSLLK